MSRTATDAVIAVLEAGGLAVGDGTGEHLDPPCVVVYPLLQIRDGTIADPWEDVHKQVQVTCEGVSREQAEWLADKVDDLMLDETQWRVVPILRPEVFRDDTSGQPSRFKAYPRYRLEFYV